MLEYRKEFREQRIDKCDFFPGEEMIFETEPEILMRVDKLKEIIKTERKLVDKLLIVGHRDLFWYLTSSVKDGKRFGTHLNNAELMEYKM